MTKLHYLQRFRDRHGKPRCYVRDPSSRKAIPISAPGGTPEFLSEYHAALELLRLPNSRASHMHCQSGSGWDQWQIRRDGERSWRRASRTKHV